MPTIVHFEIPSDNVERSKKFYTRRAEGPLISKLKQEGLNH
jgi:hypothetical protein